MDKERVFCKLCNEQTNYTRQTFCKHHLKVVHNISSKEYYDKIKTNDDGFCKTCGEKVSFRNIIDGYAEYCSNICAVSNENFQKNANTIRMEKEKLRYDGKIFLQTEQFKEKSSLSRIKKYGDKNYCNKEKIKTTKKEKYGDENYCNLEKIKDTKRERYNNENYNNFEKYKKTCLSKYDVDNFIKTEIFRLNMEKDGHWVSLESRSDFELYKRAVKKETRKWKKILYKNWNGFDFYTGKKLITHKEWKEKFPNINPSNNPDQPSIDHKISVVYGYKNKICPEIIGNIENLCICSRDTNVRKNYRIKF